MARSGHPAAGPAHRGTWRGRVPAVLSLLAVAGTALVITAPTALAGPGEGDFVARLNSARAAAGLPALSVAGDLVGLARSHSASMAAGQSLVHTANLGGAIANWSVVGENIGEGSDPAGLTAAFLASPHHRANMLDPRFTEVGIGTAVDGSGQLWVTEDFRRPLGAAAGPAPVAVSVPVPVRPPQPVPAPAPAAPPAPRPLPTAADPTPATPAAGSAAAAVPPAPSPAERLTAAGLLTPAAADPISQALHYTGVLETLAS